MKEWKVGDYCWVPFAEKRPIIKECDICFGKKVVTIILGNGDAYDVQCENCYTAGMYRTPSGTITVYQFLHGAEHRLITDIKEETSLDGKTIEYHSRVQGSIGSYYRLEPDKMFETKEEALAKCNETAAQLKKEDDERIYNQKRASNQSYSSKAGYHTRAAKEAQKQVDYHTSQAIYCKSKSKAKDVVKDN